MIGDKKKVNILYKDIKIGILVIKNFFLLDKIKTAEKIFSTKDKKHPGFKVFLNSGNNYVHGKVIKFNLKILDKFNIKKFSNIKKKINTRPKSVIAFHTRNVPHKSHEWIHEMGLRKCKKLLLTPMIFQYKRGEFKEDVIKKSYKKLVSLKKNKNINLEFYFNYPRYAGPREAIFHAIIRKNMGCSHFLVGRDHAGVKNYYTKYASQKFAKKYEKKIGIKIVTFNEPYFCKISKKFDNDLSIKNCPYKKRIYISGTKIRKIILNNKTIPEFMMRKEISLILTKKSLIK